MEHSILKGCRVGFALTGSFCTIEAIIPIISELVRLEADVTPIMSENLYKTDTRFGKAEDFNFRIEAITGKKIWHTLPEVEPIGPKKLLDIMLVAPLTGNSMAKIANGIADTAVTFAVKAQLRNNAPVLLSVSTNDGLGMNGKNLATLMNIKHIFFVPFKQDNPAAKPNSLIAETNMILPSISSALSGKQLEPVLLN